MRVHKGKKRKKKVESHWIQKNPKIIEIKKKTIIQLSQGNIKLKAQYIRDNCQSSTEMIA